MANSENHVNNSVDSGAQSQPNWVGTRKTDPRGTAHSILDIQNMPEAGHASEMQHDRDIRAQEANDRADAAQARISPLLIIAHVCVWVAMIASVLVVVLAPHFSSTLLTTFHDGYAHVGFYASVQPAFLIVTGLLSLWISIEIEIFLRSVKSELVSVKNAGSWARIGWVALVQAVLFLIRAAIYPQLESCILFFVFLIFGILSLLFSAIVRTRAERRAAAALKAAPVTDMKA
jgi:hypothetical protein